MAVGDTLGENSTKPQLLRFRLRALWSSEGASIESAVQQGTFNINSVDPREALY